MLSILVLQALVWLSATALVVTLDVRGRAERIVAVSITASALMMGPVYALGLVNLLYRGSLAAATVVLCAVVVTWCATRRGRRQLFEEVTSCLRAMLRAPWDALVLLARERSMATAAVAVAIFVFLWSGLSSYYVPSWRGWDALWYHEPMIGFTIQNHGFAVIAHAPSGIEKANGYPRLGEMMETWYALYGGRRLIDFPNTQFFPCLFAAAYGVVGVATRSVSARLGWAATAVLMPSCLNLLQSIYIDSMMAAYVLASASFTLKARWKPTDAFFASLALPQAMGSKYLAMVPVTFLAIVSLFRVVAWGRREHRPRAAAGLIAWAGGALVAMACTIYLRNWILFHNPVWPDLHVKAPSLGIDWPGALEWGAEKKEQAGDRVEMNIKLGRLLEMLRALPYSPLPWHYGETTDYGPGVGWLLLPLGGLGVLWSSVESVILLLRREVSPDVRGDAGQMLLLDLLVVAILATHPNLWAPRYHVSTVLFVAACGAWVATRLRSSQMHEAVPFAVVLMGLLVQYWAPDARQWFVKPTMLWNLMHEPYPAREVDEKLGSALHTKVGEAREALLGPGDALILRDYKFIGLLWNTDYSNQVVLAGDEPLPALASRIHAKAVVCDGSSCEPFKRMGWKSYGPISIDGGDSLYIRAVTR